LAGRNRQSTLFVPVQIFGLLAGIGAFGSQSPQPPLEDEGQTQEAVQRYRVLTALLIVVPGLMATLVLILLTGKARAWALLAVGLCFCLACVVLIASAKRLETLGYAQTSGAPYLYGRAMLSVQAAIFLLQATWLIVHRSQAA
jgi:hypothetical protein